MLFDLLIERLYEILVCHLLESIFHALDKVWVELARVVIIKYVKDSPYYKRAAGTLPRHKGYQLSHESEILPADLAALTDARRLIMAKSEFDLINNFGELLIGFLNDLGGWLGF
jgi:hypothetical protein